jgi:hypothetical protein
LIRKIEIVIWEVGGGDGFFWAAVGVCFKTKGAEYAEKTESGEKDGTLKVADRRICAKASAALPHSKGARLRRSAATRKRKSRGIKPLLLRLASQFQKYERREKKLILASG